MRFYKAVPKRFLLEGRYGNIDSWDGIQKSGLLPKRAGCLGGATSVYVTSRKPTELDYNYTWVSAEIDQARTYASTVLKDDAVILGITVPDSWIESKAIEDKGSAGWGTKQVIPPECIEVECEKADNFLPIVSYQKGLEYVTRKEDDSDDD
jgi:hypothetical protein